MFASIDHVEAYEPWSYIRAEKTLTTDDCVHCPITETDAVPEAMILDAVLGVGRLLVMASSLFHKSASVTGMHDFAFGSIPAPGETIQVKATVVRHDWNDIIVRADVSSSNNFIVRGEFTLEEAEVNDDREIERGTRLWKTMLGRSTGSHLS